ncbi:hypothetical protein FOCC_FOCC013723 [Frankliniella occidentalis]|nr:hypothetical protein FOCC_FOCC013723 [Frankliniella occidentalis]
MVAQLKDFIENNKDKKKKVLALTAAPKSWSISKLEETFGVTNFLARLSKDVVKEKGILSTPSPKVGRRLSLETEKLVIGFYLNDNHSRPLPGKKDVISVKENGIRVKKTKRLVLSTLSTLHGFYLAEHPNNPISVGKFCELRPKQCVLAGAAGAGTHIICVCTYHENPLLMFEAADLEEAGFPNVRSCREMLLCAEPTVECFLKKCQRCPDSTQLQEQLEVYFDSKEIDSVTYNQWESTDRANLLHLTKTTEEFIDDFISQVDGLITHDFISKQQAAYYKETVQNLKEGEIVVNVDFAENFSHIKQRSSQSNYFNVKQSTLHPFYMQYINGKGEIDKHCFVIISNHMDHSTVAVNIFQKKFIDYIRTTLNIEVKKITYFSDGCAAQYKNKTAIANLWFHEKDFQVPAEWQFYATSHGKTACDGIGGMVKHKVYRHCLGLTAKDLQIETAFDFYSWVKTNIEGVISIYVDSSKVTAYESTRRVRWQTALDIDGMQSHHAFIPVKPNPVVMMKLYSCSNVFELRDISTKEFQLELSEVKGFITFRENNAKWKLGLVTEHNEDTEDFEVQVLESIGKASNYQYEYTDNHSTVSLQDVLTLVNPTLQKKGKIIKILARDAKSANVKLANS